MHSHLIIHRLMSDVPSRLVPASERDRRRNRGGQSPLPPQSSPLSPSPSLKMPLPFLTALPSGDRIYHWRALTSVLAAHKSPLRQLVAAKASRLCDPATASALNKILHVHDSDPLDLPIGVPNPCLGCGSPSAAPDAFGFCSSCGEDYAAYQRLTSKPNPKYSDPGTCDHSGKYVNYLQRHVATAHEDANAGTCDHCGGYFKQLQRHVAQIHEDANGGICEYCGKYYKHLRQHIAKVHSG
ncbi:hypothetical protein V8E36_004031 [Tilletia maclaganii]